MHKKKKYIGMLLIVILVLTACVDTSTNIPMENLQVHFIDVGQGDAIFIQKEDKNMLIDAGDNKYGQRVVDYLKKNGVSRLDYIIGTHPHADHIGGFDTVIQNFEVGKVIMPKVGNNTQTFEDVLLAIKDKGLKITSPKVGDRYDLGEAQWMVVAPSKEEYDNLNNYSVVIKLEYEENAFLFTGDAETQSEREILDVHKNIISLEADVLKVGHHGSSTSTTDGFLKAVNPKVAVIQLGEDNSYGHPHREIKDKLKKNNIKVYRNDINGTIVAISDGKDIEFKVERPSKEEGEVVKAQEDYIGNKNSKVFHLESCDQLPKEENRVYFKSREEFIEKGYRPAKGCNP